MDYNKPKSMPGIFPGELSKAVLVCICQLEQLHAQVMVSSMIGLVEIRIGFT